MIYILFYVVFGLVFTRFCYRLIVLNIAEINKIKYKVKFFMFYPIFLLVGVFMLVKLAIIYIQRHLKPNL